MKSLAGKFAASIGMAGAIASAMLFVLPVFAQDSRLSLADRVSLLFEPFTQADGSIRAEPRMEMSAVVETFMTMARLPLHANILFTTVMATHMPFVGRG